MAERTDDSNKSAGLREVEAGDANMSSRESPARTTSQESIHAEGERASHAEALIFSEQEGYAGAAAGTERTASLSFASLPRRGSPQPALNTFPADSELNPADTSIEFSHQSIGSVSHSSSRVASVVPGVSTAGRAAAVAIAGVQHKILTAEAALDTSVARMPTETERQSAIVPQENDVLYGRGKQYRKHPGNKRMKLVIDLHRNAYTNANRIAKTNMSKEIVNIIKSSGDKGGRFLRFDRKVNSWVEVSDDSAREKVSHAMRDGKTRPLERIDPKVLSEMPLLSDHIKQDALRKMVASKPTGESSIQPIAGAGEQKDGPVADQTASSDAGLHSESEHEGADQKLEPG